MDQTMIDVTDVPEVCLGDEVTLYGGTGQVSVEEIARKLDTIPYEVVCAISQRVPRVYVGLEAAGEATPGCLTRNAVRGIVH